MSPSFRIGFHVHLKQARGPTVFPQQPAYLLSDLQRVLFALAASFGHGLQLLFYAPLEAIVHGLFLQLALGAAAKNEYFFPARSRAELDLKSFMHLAPVAGQQLLLKLAQHALGRTEDIAAPTLLQELHVVCRNHAAIHYPDPVGLAVLALHRLDDLFHRGHIAAIAGKYLIAKRQSAAAYN